MKQRARVFISCGQAEEDEKRIAHEIGTMLDKLDFDPYIAVEEQTLRGVKENIFGQLERSEYMVFVDFRREPLGPGGKEHRGSLFSNQELAIAAYREIEVIVLREQGVKRDGISRFVQENAVPFSDRKRISAIIEKQVEQKKWDPTWRNELSLTDEAPKLIDAVRTDRDVRDNVYRYSTRFCHVFVTNRHRDKPANNCYVYLEQITDCRSGTTRRPQTIEFKWAGYQLPNCLIAPRTSRAFDAFYRAKATIADPNTPLLRFNVFADSTQFIPRVDEPGEYEFTYRVISENFPFAVATFYIEIAEKDPLGMSI
ncbi:MAG: hypothetical protein IH969_08370, partial [Candidatus Krumholzibacteriota bacterium]|nr:hypothetical protein [Candidatus Krumholzibacteriota bacterium]